MMTMMATDARTSLFEYLVTHKCYRHDAIASKSYQAAVKKVLGGGGGGEGGKENMDYSSLSLLQIIIETVVYDGNRALRLETTGNRRKTLLDRHVSCAIESLGLSLTEPILESASVVQQQRKNKTTRIHMYQFRNLIRLVFQHMCSDMTMPRLSTPALQLLKALVETIQDNSNFSLLPVQGGYQLTLDSPFFHAKFFEFCDDYQDEGDYKDEKDDQSKRRKKDPLIGVVVECAAAGKTDGRVGIDRKCSSNHKKVIGSKNKKSIATATNTCTTATDCTDDAVEMMILSTAITSSAAAVASSSSSFGGDTLPNKNASSSHSDTTSNSSLSSNSSTYDDDYEDDSISTSSSASSFVNYESENHQAILGIVNGTIRPLDALNMLNLTDGWCNAY